MSNKISNNTPKSPVSAALSAALPRMEAAANVLKAMTASRGPTDTFTPSGGGGGPSLDAPSGAGAGTTNAQTENELAAQNKEEKELNRITEKAAHQASMEKARHDAMMAIISKI